MIELGVYITLISGLLFLLFKDFRNYKLYHKIHSGLKMGGYAFEDIFHAGSIDLNPYQSIILKPNISSVTQLPILIFFKNGEMGIINDKITLGKRGKYYDPFTIYYKRVFQKEFKKLFDEFIINFLYHTRIKNKILEDTSGGIIGSTIQEMDRLRENLDNVRNMVFDNIMPQVMYRLNEIERRVDTRLPMINAARTMALPLPTQEDITRAQLQMNVVDPPRIVEDPFVRRVYNHEISSDLLDHDLVNENFKFLR